MTSNGLMPGAADHTAGINHDVGGMVEHRGLVLHIIQGDCPAAEAWFRNPHSQASSHFGNPKTGGLIQWVNTNNKAWAEAAGNGAWVSVEHDGHAGDHLTASQLENDAQLLAWLHREYGVPLEIATSPAGHGVGHHAMGGVAWGDHLECPGAPIVAAKMDIIARAHAILGDLPPVPKPTPKPTPLEPVLRQGTTGEPVRELQTRLNAHGAHLSVDGVFGPVTATAVRDFQKAHGLAVDGVVGPATWKDLLS